MAVRNNDDKMTAKTFVPRYVVFTALCFMVFLLLMQVYKAVFYGYFSAQFASASTEEIRHALGVSLRFDIRLALMTVLPVAILPAIVPRGRFFESVVFRRISAVYLTSAAALLCLALMADAGNFAYTGERLNWSLAEFAKNPLISLGMLWQTYPVVWAAVGLGAAGYAFYKLFGAIYRLCAWLRPAVRKTVTKAVWAVVWVLLCAWGIYGSATHYPLRWSEAYFSKDKNVNSLSLNPVLFFFSSFTSADTSVDMESFGRYLPSMTRYLGTTEEVPFDRVSEGKAGPRPNIVFVMLESFGAAPMSVFGNPMNSTPCTDSLLKKCLFFSNAYVPRWGTAFTVFGSTTGIPDVTFGTTASRIPRAIDQRILMDQAEGYKRFYMLGGSANWANIRAIFQNNVDDIKIYEEGSYDTENRVDVWGIDDYDLFSQAAGIFDSLNRAGEPFIAYVQTSSNHRPYTVPDERDGFRPLREDEIDMNVLKKAGFLEPAQFNALRYLDFNISRFIKRAEEQGWAENTVFVFFGDHNMSMEPFTHMGRPEYEAELALYHVPVFIYAPSFVSPREVDVPVTLMDIFPTAFSVAGLPYVNHTLGRDMSDTLNYKDSYAFVCQPYMGGDGLTVVSDGAVYRRAVDGSGNTAFFTYVPGGEIRPMDTGSAQAQRMDSLAMAFYHSARYLYFNNRKQ